MDTDHTHDRHGPPTFDEHAVATLDRRSGSRLNVSVRRRHVDGAECVALRYTSRAGRSTTMVVFPHELDGLAAALTEAAGVVRALASDRRRP